MRTVVMAFLVAALVASAANAQPALQSILIDPQKSSIEENATTVLIAIGTYANGVRKDVTEKVAWSSGDQRIASVSTAGTVTAIAHGKTAITARLGKLSAHADLTVLPRLTGIRIEPSFAAVLPGEGFAFTVRGRYSDGSETVFADGPVWLVESNDGVATIDTGGVVTAAKAGSATVKASLHGLQATARLSVGEHAAAPFESLPIPDAAPQEPAPEAAAETKPQPVTQPVLQSVFIEPDAESLRERATEHLKAWGHYSDGSVREITAEAVWSSTDVRVARANLDGTVLALRYGSATIAATLDTYSGVAALTVEPVVARIAIRPSEVAISHREKGHVEVIAVMTDDSVHDITDRVTWSSTNESVAVAHSDGTIDALTPGEASITASFEEFTASTAVAVNPLIESLAVQPAVVSLSVGQVQQLTALGKFSDGTVRDVSSLVQWNDGAPVVRMQPGGLAIAMMEGTAIVHVRLGDAYADVRIEVTKP